MADAIKAALNIDAAVISGAKGEFTVRVSGKVVAQKSRDDFPTPEHCVKQVRAAIESA